MRQVSRAAPAGPKWGREGGGRGGGVDGGGVWGSRGGQGGRQSRARQARRTSRGDWIKESGARIVGPLGH
ncbi:MULTISPECIES: hypothetical protein [Burkholderia]|uniref:Uncharacterized protein n=2 Tax=Burkholderia mallei TaxID=13373 RepID=A2S7V7_BURM9|nr:MULTISPECIES: hypothetical protein [Burkholderia]ABM52674.1 conserved hypothetical protein [Burkholderia mallei SAVP1]ABN02480.1 hypothetical protein BMA10229_A2062 [Burkholderia mallei NCTC 10229]ABO03993.1 conserved hypothetical protein [Burkholderia mallei NCTC 10247]EDK54896.1 hypothetical protein BMAFMH_B0852 [Burkholderia mallei FMH]EDK59870.1 hypothetical protein BMAJHU_B0831 [Burkholderia mallei JHU]